MARMHGRHWRAYISQFDFSTHFSEASWSENADVHDVTTWGSSAHVFDPGLESYELILTAFYDNVNDAPYNRIQSGDTPVISLYDGDGDTIGEVGVLFPTTPVSARSVTWKAADMTGLTLSGAANGRPGGYARLLRPLGTSTNTNNHPSHDWGSSSTAGGLANWHVTAVSSAGYTLELQHSADNMTFVTLVTAETNTTAARAISTAFTGSINRYTRAYQTQSTAGATVTYVAGLARF